MMNVVGVLQRYASRMGFFPTFAASKRKPKHEDFAGAEFVDRAWLIQVRSSNRLFPQPSKEAVEKVKDFFPEQVQGSIKSAERILAHEFDLLGSGLYRPVDMSRASRNDFSPIDWNFDPISGLTFPSGIYYKDWDLWKMRPGNADVKLPWELARCQHWTALAQAWLLTQDNRFAGEIFAQRADFDEANPVGYGVHWTCTMDIAIRAANWALALEMVRDYPAPDDSWENAYRSLYRHGEFIRANLENKYEVTSNHFLSNVVGLFYLARVFNESPSAQEWESFSRQAIEKEIDVQILPDGADFESSVPYHRLVAELFLGAYRVAEYAGQPLSGHLKQRLCDMVDYLFSVMRPDGLMPQLGDADDGRLHIFTAYGFWKPQDGRHLLASASAVLKTPGWIRHTEKKDLWEACWWAGGDYTEITQYEELPSVNRYFQDAGVVIHRSKTAYLAITNGIVGTEGFGNHKHNDLLSFEYHSEGEPLIVDPGSYVYTSSLADRNLFRSTRYHNTVMIDDVEQNEMNPEWIFRLFEKANPETLQYETSDDSVIYLGRHGGYSRLETPIVHERKFTLGLSNGTLKLEDRLIGDGRHKVRWHFHLAPGIEAEVRNQTVILSDNKSQKSWELQVPANLYTEIVDAWYSPSYGVRVACKALDLTAEVQIDGEAFWSFNLTSLKEVK
jgi:hypothetical protein